MIKYKLLKIPIEIVLMSSFLFMSGTLFSQQESSVPEKIQTNLQTRGTVLEIEFNKGLEHYYPLMAIWVEDMQGHYRHPLYVARSMAKGIFTHAQYEAGQWKPGEKKIPSALPYWLHQRNIPGPDSLFVPTPEHPIADAFTGATPTGSFILKTVVSDTVERPFRVLFEINQSWDWNQHWYNSKYPGNQEYMKSAQPALVYEAVVDEQSSGREIIMSPIGHSHPYGATGELFEDISTLTTARKIAEKITVRVLSQKQ